MNNSSKLRVALFFGGVSSEHEVSCRLVVCPRGTATLNKGSLFDEYKFQAARRTVLRRRFQ